MAGGYGNAPVAHYREGLDANKPAPDTVPPGSMWFSTDVGSGGTLYVSNGSTAWRQVAPAATGGGGGSTAGAAIVRKFPFAFNTPGLETGHDIYVPTIGDVLLDAWVQVDVAFNGTTPLCDIGNYVGTNWGIMLSLLVPKPWDLTQADDPTNAGTGFLNAFANPTISQLDAAIVANTVNQVNVPLPPALMRSATEALTNTPRTLPGRFETADPVKVVVSQDGTNTGAASGATAGSGVIYLVTSTPTA